MVSMPYTLGQVPADCDPSVQSQSGVTFQPLSYRLQITGSEVKLINAAGSQAGTVVMSGTISGNNITLSTTAGVPASGLQIFSLNITLPPGATSASGSGVFRGSAAGCMFTFTFTWTLSNAVH